MRARIPYLLFLIGILGVSIFPRLSQHFSPALRTDFAVGTMIGVSIGLELLGATLMIRNRSRCRRSTT